MRIHRLAAADVPAYRALRLRALRDHPEAFTSSHEEDADQPPQAVAERLASPGFAAWGAFEGAHLYGVVGLERERRAKNRHKATVVGMYVAPELARQGVGRALLQALVAHARAAGVESLVLTVTEGNAAAQALYTAAGFRSFGIEPDAIRTDGRSWAKNHMHLALSQASP
jgi:ribosomal protein S18 acetylase RimI-like enzyme